MFETINKAIDLNFFFCIIYNIEEIRQVYILKHNSEREYQAILLIITDDAKWNYPTVKCPSGLLKGITNGNHYYINCLHS